MMSMKDLVGNLETQITQFCKKQRFADAKKQEICDLALKAITLNNQNYHLRKAIDDHRFFHSMVQLEYEHVRCESRPFCLFLFAKGLLTVLFVMLHPTQLLARSVSDLGVGFLYTSFVEPVGRRRVLWVHARKLPRD